MTFALRVARETVKNAFDSDPDLDAGTVYELEKLVKEAIARCAKVAESFDVSIGRKDAHRIRDRILALGTEEES